MSRYISLAEIFAVPPSGGHVVFLHEICRRLGGVDLVTGNMEGEPSLRCFDGVNIHRIALPRWKYVRPESLPMYLSLFAHLLMECLRDKPKAFISSRVLPEGLIANAVGRLFGVPSVIFAHGEEAHRNRLGRRLPARRKVTAFLKRRSMWRTFNNANLILANSHFTADLMRSHMTDPSKVAVVNPGTDPERYYPMPKDVALAKSLGVDGKKVILSLGRLVIRKGQDKMIQAMPRILEKVPDAVYLIAGKGNYEQELRQLASSTGMNDQVRFMGLAEDEILPCLYNLADVFVMANREMPGSGDLEGFGIVFLEANACEVPVIGGRSGGVPDAIADGKSGLLVNGDSQDEIADAVIHLLTKPEIAQEMGRFGRQRVCRELSWDHSAERVRTLLENCCR